MTDLESKIKTLISESLGVPRDEITPETDLIVDLGASPVEIADLLTNIEKELAIIIPNEEKEKVKKVSHLIHLINSQTEDFENESN